MITADATTPRIDLPLAAIRDICCRHHVRELSIFGSALRDDFRSDSDVDLLVEFEPEARIGLMEFGKLQRELEAAFGRKVDLVPKDGLRRLLRDEVLSTARALYAAA
jgi:predicted nucleotidyltransferase